MLAPLILFIGVASFQASNGTIPNGTIYGQVIDSTTGAPLLRATVSLQSYAPSALPSGMLSTYDTSASPRVNRSSNGQPGTMRIPDQKSTTFVTDASGHFRAVVTPGSYFVSAERSGYLPSSLTVAAGESTPALTLKLHKQGVITGRILDEDGEPVARVMVQPLRWAMVGGPNGQRSLMPQGESTTATNDLGEFRIFGLAPGKYILSAQPILRDSRMNDRQVYTTLYYPGVTDLASAQPIDITPGLVRPGIDLRLTRVAVVQIQGKVSPLPAPGSERRGVNMMVALQPRNANSPMARAGRQRSAPVNAQGEFTLSQVPSGSYTLIANTFGANQDRRTARLNIEVGNRDLSGLALTLEPPLTLNGRFVAEDPAILNGLIVNLHPQNTGQNVAAYGRADAQGRLTINNLEKDIYRPRFNGIPPGYYVKAVQCGNIDAQDELNLSSGLPGELTITLEKGTAELTGRVLTKDQKPAARTYVVLIQGRQPALSVLTDAQGRYTLKEIPPGDYQLFASTLANYYDDPAEFDRLTQQAQKLTLARSAKEARQVELP